jgi:SAM-dependent methyltransferase
MAFTLDEVVPWGRSFDEYVHMFDLSEEDLGLRILGCADGPASFNCGMRQRGYRVVSCDPIYQFTARQIETRIDETYDVVFKQTIQNREGFVWESIPSPEALGRVRMAAMRAFLSDYEGGKAEGRYLAASLPQLPFDGGQFDLALCSHFLFLYTEQRSCDFHQQAVQEMCRVAREVRVFPLLDLARNVSPYVEAVVQDARSAGLGAKVRRVPYEFQRGGSEMLRIWTEVR